MRTKIGESTDAPYAPGQTLWSENTVRPGKRHDVLCAFRRVHLSECKKKRGV
jgi:hypothetical protein